MDAPRSARCAATRRSPRSSSLGAGAIDVGLLAGLEGAAIITQVADDLYDVFAEGQPPDTGRYPAEPADPVSLTQEPLG